MKDYRNYVPVLITALNIAVAVLFTRADTTGSFPDFLHPYKGLLILCYFFSWPTTLILIAVLLIIIIKDIRDGVRALSPYLILFPNIGYLVYMCFRLYSDH